MDKRKFSQIITLIMLATFCFNPLMKVLAATVEEKQQELEAVNQQIEVKKIKKEQAKENTKCLCKICRS